MANKAWLWFGGMAWVVAGCSGKVLNDAGPAGSPAPSAAVDDDAPAGPLPVPPSSTSNGGAGGAGPVSFPEDAGAAGYEAGGAPSCGGTLEEVADLWGFSCPKDLCAANVLASDCSALPSGTQKTSYTDYGFDDKRISFELSPTRRKVCYYSSDEHDGVSLLIAAEAWDDQASFCDGAFAQIRGGQHWPRFADPAFDEQDVRTLCDLAHPEQGQRDDGTPPRACYNRFGHSCEACCPKPVPDCSDKPNGFPGYECTPADPGNASYCSCSCNGNTWQCAC